MANLTRWLHAKKGRVVDTLTAREQLRDPSAINLPTAELDQLSRDAGYIRDGLGYVKVVSVEKATEPGTTEGTITVATFAQGAASQRGERENQRTSQRSRLAGRECGQPQTGLRRNRNALQGDGGESVMTIHCCDNCPFESEQPFHRCPECGATRTQYAEPEQVQCCRCGTMTRTPITMTWAPRPGSDDPTRFVHVCGAPGCHLPVRESFDDPFPEYKANG